MNSIQSPRSSHHNSSARNSNDLQFQDISHLPITYPSPTPSINQNQQQQPQQQEYEQRRTRIEEEYVDDNGEQGDEDDEWELDREYVDVGAADSYGECDGSYGPVRPSPIHRESQDVEFGNRLTSMRSLRGRGRTSTRLHMMHVKGLQRGKTALIRTLRGGLRRANISGHSHHTSGSGHSPPFEFRDPQPAPASIRLQYAELAPPDSAGDAANRAGENTGLLAPATHEMRTENGLLAPPVNQNGPIPNSLFTTTSLAPHKRASLTVPTDADSGSERRHSRSQSAIYQSQSRPDSTHTARPRSRSVGSHRSRVSVETVVAPNGSVQMHDNRRVNDEDVGDDEDSAETTLVQHVNDLTLTPIPLPQSKSSPQTSRHSKDALHPDHYSRPLDVRFPRPLFLARYAHSRTRSRLGRYTSKTKSSLVRAIQAFNRLPWMAAHEDPRGALFPTDYYPTPRITKDFIPARSGRGRLRDSLPPGSGLVYKKAEVSLQELTNEEGDGSWYLPGNKQLRRNLRAQHYRDQQRARVLGTNVGVGGLGGSIARPAKQAYASYRAVMGRSGRPLDYMYAPSRSMASPSIYSTRQHSHADYDRHLDTRREGAGAVTRSRSAAGSVDREVGAALYGVENRPGSISAAASAYLARSASGSQASSLAGSQSGRRRMVEYIANGGGTNVPPSNSASGFTGLQRSHSFTQAQNQGQNQQQHHQQPVYGYTYAYPTSQSQSQIQGHPVQYYTYGFAYAQPQSQSYSRTRVPGSSPPLPPIPVESSTATSGYAGSGSIPTIPSLFDQSASAGSSQLSSVSEHSYTRPHEHRHRDRHGYENMYKRENDDRYWSGDPYSYEYKRGYGYGDRYRHYREPANGGGHFGRSASGSSSGSGSSADSGYETVVPGSIPVGVNSGRYADYAHSSYVR